MRNLRLISFLSLLAVSTLASTSARADTAYTYTGNPYTVAEGSYTTSDFASFTFTVATPLADNLLTGIILPLSYSISDAAFPFGNSALDSLSVSTDESGKIVDWNISIQTPDFANGISGNEFLSGASFDEGATLTDGENTFAFNAGIPGTWTSTTGSANLTSTPEPSSLILLGTGALGLFGVARRRFGRV